MKKHIFLFLLISSMCSCSTNVRLKATNPMNYPQIGEVRISASDGESRGIFSLGTVAPNATASANYTVRDGSNLELVGMTTTSGTISSRKYPITGTPDPYDLKVVMSSQFRSDIEDIDAVHKSIISEFPDPISAPFYTLNDSIQTMLGALVIAAPQGAGRPLSIITTIQANVLGVKPTSLEDLAQGEGRSIAREAIVKNMHTGDMKASYPLVGGLNLSVSSDRLYKLKLEIKGLKTYTKKEDPDKTPSIQISKLPEAVRKDIIQTLRNNTEAKLFYIDRIVFAKNIRGELAEGQQVTQMIDGQVDGIISGQYAYTFSQKQTKTDEQSQPVLAFVGSPMGQYSLFAKPDSVTASVTKIWGKGINIDALFIKSGESAPISPPPPFPPAQ